MAQSIQAARHSGLPSAAQVAMSMASRANRPRPEGVREAAGTLTWLLCFFSFVGLQAIEKVGTIGAVAFIAPWTLLTFPRLPVLFAALLADWAMLLLPLFAIASTVWSPEPAATLRAALEYLATVVIGIAAARCIGLRPVMTSILSAITGLTGVSLVIARHRFSLASSVGLYASHNQLAAFSCVGLLISGAFLLLDKLQPWRRALLFAIALVNLAGAGVAHSTGALVALVVSAGAVSGLKSGLLRRLEGRAAALAFSLIALVVVASVGFSQFYGSLLKSLGKNATLTGRTDLWSEGLKQISEAPLSGVGYGAFWVPGNPIAEKLWAAFGITGKIGFHFHESFINTAVELGLPAALLLGLLLIVATRRLLGSLGATSDAAGAALAGTFFLFLILCFIEAEFTLVFYLSTIILCLVWARREGQFASQLVRAQP